MQQFLWSSGTDKAGDVHIDEGGHEELTVETIHYTTVAGNHITKVLFNIKQLSIVSILRRVVDGGRQCLSVIL